MNEFKVGLLTLVAAITVVYMSLRITTNQSGFGEYVTYRSIISDAAGIFSKTPIKVAGITAGRIKQVELQGNQALITFEVLKKIKISKDSTLKIKTVGFLGDKYLEILVGKDEERLEENAFLVAEVGGGIEELIKGGNTVLNDIRAITDRLRTTIVPEKGPSIIDDILANVNVTASNAREMTEKINRVLLDNEARITQILANLEGASSKLNHELDASKKDTIVADLKAVLEDVKAVTADIRRGKGTVGKLLVEEDIADEVKSTLASVRKIVNRVDTIKTELAVYTGVDSEAGGLTDASIKIFPGPERFYLLGVTTSKFGIERKKDITSEVGGVQTKEYRVERDRDTYRFNIMIGRKINNWTFRGGLIETTGGAGIDYERRAWGTRFFADIFDIRKGLGPNLRVGTDIHLWNVFYGRIAGEDLVTEFRSFNVSAGLKFNDEDLKGLLGFIL